MNDFSNINQEIEIKLNLASFTNYLKLIGFLGQIEQEEHHLNVFFDTENRSISNIGWALRVRAESNRGLVTIKSIPTKEGLAVIRQEIESEITKEQSLAIINSNSDIMSLDIMPIQFIKDKIGNVSLQKLVMFENIRQKKVFRLGDNNYILEIDKTEYNDGSVDYELELELKDNAPLETIEDQLKKIFISLDIPFKIQTESKFHRALKKAEIL
jgi:uncharacterized protein YjbK